MIQKKIMTSNGTNLNTLRLLLSLFEHNLCLYFSSFFLRALHLKYYICKKKQNKFLRYIFWYFSHCVSWIILIIRLTEAFDLKSNEFPSLSYLALPENPLNVIKLLQVLIIKFCTSSLMPAYVRIVQTNCIHLICIA